MQTNDQVRHEPETETERKKKELWDEVESYAAYYSSKPPASLEAAKSSPTNVTEQVIQNPSKNGQRATS